MTAHDRWTRRDFLSATAVGLVGLVRRGGDMGGVDERLAYVGTYTSDGRSDGIYRLRLDTATGALRIDGLAVTSVNPSYLALHPNGRVLYAVNEISEFAKEPTGAVSAFAIARTSGALTLLNQQASHGQAPCYVSVDRTGTVVLVANYGGGSITTIPVRQDGRLGLRGTW
jgi:6-phosphogluconolactonase